MIKRFLHILALAALVCSCVKEDPLPRVSTPSEDELGYEHDGKVTLGFNVDLGGGMGEGTKSLAETPDIRNIYVAVFDTTGYKLSEYVKANPITTGPVNDKKYQFTIQLKVSDKPRTLHFIANGPKELRFGTEQEVIGELYSRYDADESDEYSRKDAYWQRLVFKKISPRPVTDDADSLAAYNSMCDTLSNLKLIRNFSKVTLSKRAVVTEDTQAFKDFQILGMWFVNYPDRGSIAPYNRNTGAFGTDLSHGGKRYLDYSTMEDIENPAKGNYQGFTHASTIFVTPTSFSGNMIAATDNTAVGYVYEREKALTSPMYLIVKGKYNNADTYYKIAMQDENGSFYAMLRNFNYSVQIQDVTAAGYGSAQAALDGAPTGDISVNIDYKDLPNISDGNARITVSATKLLIVGEDGEETTADFWYKYEPDITDHSDTGIHNNPATGVEATDKAEPHVLITYEGTEGSTGAVVSSLSVATTNVGGNRHVTINTTAASVTPKTQTITIEGRRWDGSRYQTITRTVQLVLRDALEMTLSASPNTGSYTDNTDPANPKSYDAAHVLAQTGQPVVVHIGIDQDLPSSVFPLYFKVAPRTKSLTPDNNYASVQELPVRYGTDASGHPTYWFEKAISWAEYEGAHIVNGKKQFDVYFKTILAANETLIDVSNDYFVPGAAMVRNYTAAKFTNLNSTPKSGTGHIVGQEETFSFNVNQAYKGDITFKFKGFEPMPSSGLTFKEVDGSGNRVYTKAVDVAAGATISVDVMPYIGGNATISLSAFLFEDSDTYTEKVTDPDIPSIYLNTSGSGNGTRFIQVTGTDVNNGNLVPGMKATMTIYIADDKASGASSVTVGSYTFSKKASDTSVPGYTAYSGTYTAPSSGDNSAGFTDTPIVTVSGNPIGSVSVPVYGILQGDEATSSPFNSSVYYLIKSAGNRYMYNPGSNNAKAILKIPVNTTGSTYDPIQYKYLMKINGGVISTVSSSTPYYLDFNYSRSGWGNSYSNFTYSYTPQLDSSNDSGIETSFTYNYQSGSGFTLCQTFDEKTHSSYSANYVTRYMYDNNGTIAQNTTAAYWHIYPVTFVAP